MNNLSKAFIAAALLYFGLGSLLGLLILFSRMQSAWSGWDYYLIPPHTHLNLLGWMSMTIYAMGYRAFPAFFGKSLHSLKLAWLHFWCANLGLTGMALFFFLNRLQEGSWGGALAFSGALQYAGILVFLYNMARSIFSKPKTIPSP